MIVKNLILWFDQLRIKALDIKIKQLHSEYKQELKPVPLITVSNSAG